MSQADVVQVIDLSHGQFADGGQAFSCEHVIQTQRTGSGVAIGVRSSGINAFSKSAFTLDSGTEHTQLRQLGLHRLGLGVAIWQLRTK